MIVRIRAMWSLPVTWVIRAIDGEGRRGHPDGTTTGTLILEAASLRTGNTKRDHRVRSGEFLDIQTHPTMVFEVTGGTLVATRELRVEGGFTARGVTRPDVAHRAESRRNTLS